MPNEFELVQQAQTGDIEAFGKLYDWYVKKIYHFVYYKTWHRETAEDLTSQTFFKALNAIKKFDAQKSAFSTWLYQIARNNVIDHFRTLKTTTQIEDAFDLNDNTDLPRDLETKLQLEKVRAGLAVLSKEQREIVILRLWEGLSHKEIANIMQKNETAIKMSFSRSIAKLKQEIVLLLLFLPFLLKS